MFGIFGRVMTESDWLNRYIRSAERLLRKKELIAGPVSVTSCILVGNGYAQFMCW